MLQLRSVEARLIDRSSVVNTTGRGILFHSIPCALWRVVLGGRHLWQGTDSGARVKPERMGYWDWDPCGAPSSSIFHDFHSDLRSQSIIRSCILCYRYMPWSRPSKLEVLAGEPCTILPGCVCMILMCVCIPY
jgi:hypothetical protein